MASPIVGLILRGSLDSDVRDWAARAVANGGSVSEATKRKADRFARSAKGNGYWPKLNRINLFGGGGGTAAQNFAACLVPLKIGGGSATDTNVNFVSGDYTELTGLTGNGTTKYLNTGLVPSTSLASVNSCHIAVYSRLPSQVGGGAAALGCSSAGNALLQASFPNSSDGNFYSWAGTSTFAATAVPPTPPYRLAQGVRTGATAAAVYQNGVLVASSAGAATSLPTVAAYVFNRNSSGVATDFSSQVLGAYSIGDGFTAAEAAAYAADMQTFQAALGRSV